jgi:hypothetical protein
MVDVLGSWFFVLDDRRGYSFLFLVIAMRGVVGVE